MYSLDVNFLRERREQEEPTKVTEEVTQPTVSVESNLPLIIGAVIAVILPAAVGGFWYWTTVQTSQLEEEIAQLEKEINQIRSRRNEIENKIANQREALQREKANLDGLVNIFNDVKPLSAILEDVNDRAPIAVQINSLNQNSQTNFTLSGVGASYEIVNYFYLTLKRSPFIKPDSVQLSPVRKSNYTMPTVNQPDDPEVSSGEIVNYDISFELRNKPSYQLLPLLEEQGATGLSTRFRALEIRGILQQPNNE